jgi:hypothetical protein
LTICRLLARKELRAQNPACGFWTVFSLFQIRELLDLRHADAFVFERRRGF